MRISWKRERSPLKNKPLVNDRDCPFTFKGGTAFPCRVSACVLFDDTHGECLVRLALKNIPGWMVDMLFSQSDMVEFMKRGVAMLGEAPWEALRTELTELNAHLGDMVEQFKALARRPIP